MKHENPVAGHIQTVDFARGVCAMGVLAYHVLHYTDVVHLDRISRYAVYAFFAISGFALYFKYRDRLGTAKDISIYAVRRFWRIAPLFYFAVALNFIFGLTAEGAWLKLPANLLLIFGFMSPGDTSLVTGGWSIGVEMVFYALLPIIIAFAGGQLGKLIALALLAVITQTTLINYSATLNFGNYVQPASFLGYFLFGCLFAEMYLRRPDWKGLAWPWVAAGGAVIGLFLIPATSTHELLAGWTGLALCLLTIIAVGAVAFLPEPTGSLLEIAKWFGRMSYPVYLLHPIVFQLVAKILPGADTSITIAATIVLTIAASETVNRCIEKPGSKFGRKFELNYPPRAISRL